MANVKDPAPECAKPRHGKRKAPHGTKLAPGQTCITTAGTTAHALSDTPSYCASSKEERQTAQKTSQPSSRGTTLVESQWKRQVKHSGMQAQQTAPQHREMVAPPNQPPPSVGAPVAAHDGHARRTRELHERGRSRLLCSRHQTVRSMPPELRAYKSKGSTYLFRQYIRMIGLHA